MLLPLILVAAGLFVVAVGLGLQRGQVGSQASTIDVALGARDVEEEQPEAGLSYRAVEPLLEVGSRLFRRISPTGRLRGIRNDIVYAGLEGSTTVERILGYKAASAALGLLLSLVFRPGFIPALLWIVAVTVLFSFIPDILLNGRAVDRQTKISRGLPEALDLLALTVEAGLGLEQALDVVVENSTGPLAGEFNRLLREVELGVSRRDALGALRERTNVPELSSFVVAMVQGDTMGIAVADVLKTQAAQVRLRRTQAAREQAAKTPVQILFPLIIGIFPALFVVTIGPGAINIAKALTF